MKAVSTSPLQQSATMKVLYAPDRLLANSLVSLHPALPRGRPCRTAASIQCSADRNRLWQPQPDRCRQQWQAPCRIARVNAAASSNSATMQLVPVEVPNSQQAAVNDAAQALALSMQPVLSGSKANRKGFSKGSRAAATAAASNVRLSVEIPILDAAAATATAELAVSLISSLSSAVAPASLGPISLVCADVAAAEAARRKVLPAGAKVLALQEACRQPALSGILVLAAPSVADVALVEQLLDEVWVGPAVATLNAAWSSSPVPQEYVKLVDSFDVVYSFLPINIKGFLGGKEGAVLRRVDKSGAAFWKVLYQQKDQFVQVGQMKSRPTADDLELSFLNASAATSPLTAAAKFFRGLVPAGKTDKK